MILSDQLIFVHIGKTAGTTLTNALLRILPGDVHAIGKIESMPETTAGRIIQVAGNHHATLAEAQPALWFRYNGVAPDQWPLILAVIRNPYDRAHSLYAWTQQISDLGAERTLTHQGFSSYVMQRRNRRGGPYWPVSAYLLIRETLPPTVRLIRYENLAEEFAALTAELGLEHHELPLLNASRHGSYRDELTPEAEEEIFLHENWLFTGGYYQREPVAFTSRPTARSRRATELPVPVSGPLVIDAPMLGVHADNWVTTSFQTTIRAIGPISAIEASFPLPDHLPANTPALFTVNDEPFGRLVSGGETVDWRVPLVMGRGRRVAISLGVGDSVRPADTGGSDIRQLRLLLNHLTAIPDEWAYRLRGGVLRKGPAEGLYPDDWIAPDATVGLEPSWTISGIDIALFVPEIRTFPVTITATVSDAPGQVRLPMPLLPAQASVTVDKPGPVTLSGPVIPPIGRALSMHLTVDPPWTPSSEHDARQLGVLLRTITGTYIGDPPDQPVDDAASVPD